MARTVFNGFSHNNVVWSTHNPYFACGFFAYAEPVSSILHPCLSGMG
jgi:hypothetical protein